MKDETRAALKDQNTWLKLPVMLLFFLLLAIVTPVLILVSFVGWVILLVTGQRSEGVTEFGQTLAKWYSQTARYLTGGAERRPFPFEDLDCPRDEPMAASGVAAASRTKPASSKSSAQTAVEKPARAPETRVPEKSPEKSAAGKSGSKKSSSKKSSSKKSASKKAGSKKAGSNKASGKKSTARKASSKKAGSKKSASKKTTASDQAAAGSDSPSDDGTT